MRRALTIAAAVALGLSGAAAAQPSPHSFEAGVAWGRSFGGAFAKGATEAFDVKVESDTAILKGIRVAYTVSTRASLELLAERVDTRFVTPADGVFASRTELGVLQMRFVEIGARYALLPGRVTPFAGGGIGLAVLDPDIPRRSDVRDANRLALHAVLGFKAYLWKSLGVRLDVRPRFVYLGTRRLGEDGGAFDSGRWFTHVDGDAGLFVIF